MLVILPSLSLPPHCTHTLSVRRREEVIFSSCSSLLHPVMITIQGEGIWVDLSTTRAQPSNISATGFMVSIILVQDELAQLIEAVLKNDTKNEQVKRIKNTFKSTTRRKCIG